MKKDYKIECNFLFVWFLEKMPVWEKELCIHHLKYTIHWWDSEDVFWWRKERIVPIYARSFEGVDKIVPTPFALLRLRDSIPYKVEAVGVGHFEIVVADRSSWSIYGSRTNVKDSFLFRSPSLGVSTALPSRPQSSAAVSNDDPPLDTAQAIRVYRLHQKDGRSVWRQGPPWRIRFDVLIQ